MPKTDHIVVRNVSGGHQLECMNCGQTYTPTLPCPIPIFLDTMASFNRLHRACEPRVMPSPEAEPMTRAEEYEEAARRG